MFLRLCLKCRGRWSLHRDFMILMGPVPGAQSRWGPCRPGVIIPALLVPSTDCGEQVTPALRVPAECRGADALWLMVGPASMSWPVAGDAHKAAESSHAPLFMRHPCWILSWPLPDSSCVTTSTGSPPCVPWILPAPRIEPGRMLPALSGYDGRGPVPVLSASLLSSHPLVTCGMGSCSFHD